MLNKTMSQFHVNELRFEHLKEALGIGTPEPRLSWITKTSAKNWRQSAYEVEAYDTEGQLLARSGKVKSDESVLVAWPFASLTSRQRLQVRVRVWGSDDQPSEWSALTPVEAGLLHIQDWSAQFVAPEWEQNTSHPQACPMLRREFYVRAGIRQARLYITALGVYEAQINGVIVGDHVLPPGWTSYQHRLRYQTFDVTRLLRDGRNAIGAILGDGWYRGRLGFNGGRRNIYGDTLALLAQLEIEFEDGTTECIVSDEDWRAASGPILSSELYDGERYDARLERPGWSAPGYDADDWNAVHLVEHDLSTLVAPSGPPVRRIELVAPVAVTTSPSGRKIVDFGQNLVGRLRIRTQGNKGQKITIRHAEVLEDGELCTRPLRFAKATDEYTLCGDGIEKWEPRFTFHGFRYAEVNGWPGELQEGDIHAVVCHSDMERIGWFECSDPLINRLHDNVIWSMRGNFLDIPTDCPQRDERLGWTGDLQVFSPTAAFLYHANGFLQSWLRDLAVEQRESDGRVPHVVPNILGKNFGAAAAWADAATVVPRVLYQRFGDLGILAEQFESMCAWVDYVEGLSGENHLWDTGFQFGDWLDPTAPPDKPAQARTDKAIVASAYFVHSADLVARAAEVLGRTAEKEHYSKLAVKVKAAFAHEYITPAGRLMSDAETAYVLALTFDLLPTAEQRQHAGDRLFELVREGGYHIRTGFVGTPLICDALCSTGHAEAAYRLLMQQECPSWLYPVVMGATTVWERWDSMLPDGSINPGEMTSFNHYALGAVADWMHRTIGGLAPAEPGYRRIDFRPRPGGDITSAYTRHHTPYGIASCFWKLEEGKMTVEIDVPPNTNAWVSLPGKGDQLLEIGSGSHRWSYRYPKRAKLQSVLTLDSTLAEFIDHPQVYALVKNIFLQHNEEFADRMDDQMGMTLREAIYLNPRPEELRAKIEPVLALRI